MTKIGRPSTPGLLDSRYVNVTGDTMTGDLQTVDLLLSGGDIYPTADSTTAIQINKADGTTNVLNVDTTNGFVGIGTDNPTVHFHIQGRDMYYTTSDFDTGEGTGSLLEFSFGAETGNTYASLQALIGSWNDYGNLILQGNGGKVGIGISSLPTNATKLVIEDGLTFKETTAPTADTNYGKMWTNTSDELWFQDGAGVSHLLHGDAFSNIWFHSPSTVEVTISAQDTFTKIDSFTVVGKEDDALNVVGSVSTNDLTLSASGGGEYEISYHGSVTATGGADKDMMVAFGITLATPKDITDVTDDTISPIVITSTAHGLKEGDMVEIVGVLGNAAANGSFIVDNETANTFEIVALDGTATTGDGDFDAGSPTGDVTIEYPGNMVVHRTVRGADPGAISATGLHILADSDVLALYVANLVGTTNLTVLAVSLDVVRIGD